MVAISYMMTGTRESGTVFRSSLQNSWPAKRQAINASAMRPDHLDMPGVRAVHTVCNAQM